MHRVQIPQCFHFFFFIFIISYFHMYPLSSIGKQFNHLYKVSIILVRPKLEYAAPIWSPYSKLQINQVEKVQRTAARWTCRRWRNTSSVGEMLDKLEWPSLEARRDQSSLLLFHKIHSGAVSIGKDKYLTPARSLKSTRSSHSAQYCRYQTYSDALKNSFFPPDYTTVE